MVHNGIEYGMMASIAEGLSIIKHANAGKGDPGGRRRDHAIARPVGLPVRHRRRRGRRGVAPRFGGRVLAGRPHRGRLRPLPGPRRLRRQRVGLGRGPLDGAGRGRRGSAGRGHHGALYERFESRGLGEFTDKILSAMRSEFGGHAEKKQLDPRCTTTVEAHTRPGRGGPCRCRVRGRRGPRRSRSTRHASTSR